MNDLKYCTIATGGRLKIFDGIINNISFQLAVLREVKPYLNSEERISMHDSVNEILREYY